MSEINQELIDRIFDLFIHRDDVYAIQKEDGTYYRIKEPITGDLIRKHLMGELTIGIYQFSKNNTIKWICFDFDGDNLEEVWNDAYRFYLKLKDDEKIGSVILEFSGKKGYHVWVFCEEIDGASARYWAEQVSRGFKCEIFPKQEKITEFGNLVKLPMGIHQITKKRAELIKGNLFSFTNKMKITKVLVKEVVKYVGSSNKRQEMPEWIRTLIEDGVEEGIRDKTRFKIIANLKRCNYTNEEITALVDKFNNNCRPPEDKHILENHIKYTLEHIDKYLEQGIEITKEIEGVEPLSDLEEIFGKIVKTIKSWEDLEDGWAEFLAVWIIGTYLHDRFNSFPLVFLNAPKGSGKTRLLRLCEMLSNNGLLTVSFTEATLFRYGKYKKVTFFFDETESLNSQQKQNLRELIHACYKKGVKIIRFKKVKGERVENYYPEEFQIYCPIMLANISGITDILQDRCIAIVLEKSTNLDIIKKPEYFELDPNIFLIKQSLLDYYYSPVGVTHQTDTMGLNHKMEKLDSVYSGGSVNSISSVNIDSARSVYSVTEAADYLAMNIKNINGREIELWAPILTIAKMISENVFNKLFQLCQHYIEEYKAIDIFDNPETALLISLIRFVKNDGWFSVSEITKNMKELYVETEISGGKEIKKYPKWITNDWVGRRLKTLKLPQKLRRRARREVYLSVSRIEEKAKKRGLEIEEIRKEQESEGSIEPAEEDFAKIEPVVATCAYCGEKKDLEFKDKLGNYMCRACCEEEQRKRKVIE